MSVSCWLVQELGLDPEYVAKEIGAAFLDGRPLDDFDAALLHPGATLALGAAVPGLVGISLNRGSPLACFRHDISQGTAAEKSGGQKGGSVRLKLFNFPARALARRLAERGIALEAGQLEAWCAENRADLVAGGARFFWTGGEAEAFSAASLALQSGDFVLLRARKA